MTFQARQHWRALSDQLAQTRSHFSTYAWIVLGYNILVIVWGQVVLASGSGDGCGDRWPLCGDHLIPTFKRLATLIEYLHRLSTGVDTLLLLILVAWAFLAFPKRHPARFGALLAILFTFFEALLGAILVLFGLVDKNTSVARVIAMSAHQSNTLLLLASIALTAWWGSGGARIQWSNQGIVAKLLLGLLITVPIVAISGAIAGLADTLYPSHNLAQAIGDDFRSGTPYLVHLRAFHPFLAILVMVFACYAASRIWQLRPTLHTKRYAQRVYLLFLIELTAGVINLSLLAPIWARGLHLLIADLLWVNVVLLAAAALPKHYVTTRNA